MLIDDFITFNRMDGEIFARYYCNHFISTNGRVFSWNNKHKKCKFLSPAIDKYGYYKINIKKDAKTINKYVHRMVAEVFIENPLNLMIVNHKDGNKLNNLTDNLEWCTTQQNTKHSIESGLTNFKGSNNPNSKISSETVRSIKEKYSSGIRIKEISSEYGLLFGHVSKIVNGRIWK